MRKIRNAFIVNMFTGILLGILAIKSATIRGYDAFGFRVMFVVPLVLLFFVLFFRNFVLIFTRWKDCRYYSMVPMASYFLAFAVCWAISHYGVEYVLKGTIFRPETFFTKDRKSEFTTMAESLLGQDLKKISFFSDGKLEKVSMIAGYKSVEIPDEVLVFMKKYSFKRCEIDDRQNIVEFMHYDPRTWYVYMYSRNELKTPWSMLSEITETDIQNWDSIICYARMGNVSDDYKRKKLQTGDPRIIYPHLEKTLGVTFLEKIKSYKDSSLLTPDDKSRILETLNKQRLAESRLIENPYIRYGKWTWHNEERYGLNIASDYEISDGFWVVGLLKDLLKEGVITVSGDEGRMSLKAELSPYERQRVEWLHVGLMNFVYGAIINKEQHPFQKQISENWYFYVD